MPDAGRLIEPESLLATLLQAADGVRTLVASADPAARIRRADGHPDQFEIDVAADEACTSVLVDAGLGVLSEESGFHQPSRPILVVLDPIDGSTNCSRDIGPYGPSLCAVDADGPLAAVVADLASERTYTAIRGGGAWRNGSPIHVPVEREPYLLATGDPSPALDDEYTTRVSGASAHDLCRVADGTFDGYLDGRNTESVWDYLGGMLVLLEAGGAIDELAGLPLLDLSARADRRLVAAHSAPALEKLRYASVFGSPSPERDAGAVGRRRVRMEGPTP